MYSDPIADFLTRIRNAQMAGHKIVEIPSSNLKKRITEILYEQGFIHRYTFEELNPQDVIKIALKYKKGTSTPLITNIKRISKPGLRQFSGVDQLPRVIDGLGVAIVSTSKGVMTAKEARSQNVGGEILCEVY